MGVVNFYSSGGHNLAQEDFGAGSFRGYAADGLTSVACTVNSAGTTENTYRFKPYGTLLAKSGTVSDPPFLWVGILGYRQTARVHAEVYMRARHYGSGEARWATVDPEFEDRSAYVYVVDCPITFIDPRGTHCQTGSAGVMGARIGAACGVGLASDEYSGGSIDTWECEKQAPDVKCPRALRDWTRQQYCRDCLGLCNNYCNDYECGDKDSCEKCEAKCNKRNRSCRSDKNWPPVF